MGHGIPSIVWGGGMGLYGLVRVFYKCCIRTLFGVSRATHNEVLYGLSGRGPLQLYLARAVFRFVLHSDEHPSLLGSVAAWVRSLDSERVRSGLFLGPA